MLSSPLRDAIDADNHDKSLCLHAPMVGVSRPVGGVGGMDLHVHCSACLEGGAGVTECKPACLNGQACKHALTRVEVLESFSKIN